MFQVRTNVLIYSIFYGPGYSPMLHCHPGISKIKYYYQYCYYTCYRPCVSVVCS